MIRLDHVGKRFPNGQVAVGDLSLEIPTGETCILVGPSGCGKTTTLRMINRLIEPTSGRIFHDEEDVTRIDPVRIRLRMGYVIQQVGLFPHLTIANNVATVPRLLGWERARTARRVDELLELVGLPPDSYRDRYPGQLSGGQQQRVGVARALGADPPVLLMDEPFGALDRVTRDRLQNEFLRIQREMRKTIVFVTHDIDEAIKLGDRIALLNVGGVLEQYDTPARILAQPANDFVAQFLGPDRGQKRLSVTPIDPGALASPPVVQASATIAEAEAARRQTGSQQVVVLDGRRFLGVLEGEANQQGRAADHAHHPDLRVAVSGSLSDALSQLLLFDSRWAAVVDGENYVGLFRLEDLPSMLEAAAGQASTDRVSRP